MIVRIRLGHGVKVGIQARKQHRLALGVAGVLTPAAVMATALAAWKLASDLKLTGSFAIVDGFFSHWQVWLGAAVLLQVCSHLLNKYGKDEEPAAS